MSLCSLTDWHRLVPHLCCLAIAGLRNLRVLGRKGANQRKMLCLSNFCSKTWISEPGMLVLPVGDCMKFSFTLEQFLCGVSAGSRWNSQGVTDPRWWEDPLLRFSQQRKGAGWNSTWPFPAVLGALFPPEGSACAQQISQQLRNTNAGRNYPTEMQGGGNGKSTLKTSPVNFSGKLPLGTDWVKLGSDLTFVFH